MTKRNSRPAVLHLRSLKGEPGTNLPSLSKARLKELIEQAIVDAYGEEEQVGGFFTMLEEYLALPFRVKVLGVDVDVEKVDMTLDGQIALLVDPFKEPLAKLTKHRTAPQQENASSFLGLGHCECLDSSSGRQCDFLRGSPITSTVDPEAVVINPTSLVKSHRLPSMCPHGWLSLVGSDVSFYVGKIILYPATKFHVSRANSCTTPITECALGHVPHFR